MIVLIVMMMVPYPDCNSYSLGMVPSCSEGLCHTCSLSIECTASDEGSKWWCNSSPKSGYSHSDCFTQQYQQGQLLSRLICIVVCRTLLRSSLLDVHVILSLLTGKPEDAGSGVLLQSGHSLSGNYTGRLLPKPCLELTVAFPRARDSIGYCKGITDCF